MKTTNKLITSLFLFVAMSAFSAPRVPTLDLTIADLKAFHEGTFRSDVNSYALTAEEEAKIAAEVKKEDTAAKADAKEKELKHAALVAKIRAKITTERTKLVDKIKPELLKQLGLAKDSFVVHGSALANQTKTGEVMRLQLAIYKSEAAANSKSGANDYTLVNIGYAYDVTTDEDGNQQKGVKPEIAVSVTIVSANSAMQTLK